MFKAYNIEAECPVEVQLRDCQLYELTKQRLGFSKIWLGYMEAHKNQYNQDFYFITYRDAAGELKSLSVSAPGGMIAPWQNLGPNDCVIPNVIDIGDEEDED